MHQPDEQALFVDADSDNVGDLALAVVIDDEVPRFTPSFEFVDRSMLDGVGEAFLLSIRP